MSPYQPTHIPYGLTDPSKRIIRNPGLKDEVEFKHYGLETNGEDFLVRILVQPKGGVPFHRHASYGETFFPVQGEVCVIGHNGAKTMMLSKGETYSVKPGEWHRFYNPSETEAIVCDASVTPAHQGFEKQLHILYGLVADGYGTPEGIPRSLYHLLMLTDMGEMSFPGWSGMLMSSMAKVVGLLAKWTGEEERLVQKYYGRPITEEDRKRYKIA